jgi:hypothetical protein
VSSSVSFQKNLYIIERAARASPRQPGESSADDRPTEARVINRGKNVGDIECDVTDPEGKRVAKVHSTGVV